MRHLSRKFWEKKAEALFNEWDAIDDPYGLPINEFQKASAKIGKASRYNNYSCKGENEEE